MEDAKLIKRPTEPVKFTIGSFLRFFMLGIVIGFLAFALLTCLSLAFLGTDDLFSSEIGIAFSGSIGFFISCLIVFFFDKNTIETGDFMVDNEVETRRIDGCEYLGFKTSHGHRVYCHKGNCDNPIHQRP